MKPPELQAKTSYMSRIISFVLTNELSQLGCHNCSKIGRLLTVSIDVLFMHAAKDRHVVWAAETLPNPNSL